MAHFIWTMRRWKAGKVPSFAFRREVVEFLEQAHESRFVLDAIYGANVVNAVMDKARRRGMAVWRAKTGGSDV